MKDDRIKTNELDTAVLSDSRNSLSSLDGHIPVLDGIRGVAILLVMAYHFLHPGGHILAIVPEAIARAGWVGVDLFFVLSGFLITGILLKTKADPHYLRNFYMRRTLRIFPLYYAFLTCLFVVGASITSLNTPGFKEVAKHQLWLWTYTANIGQYWTGKLLFASGWVEANHLWSLAVEEQFYLVWPAIVLLFSRRALMRLCICIIASAFIFRVMSQTMGDGFVLWRADALIVGGLIAILLRDPKWAPRMKALASRTLLVTGCLIAGIVIWRRGFPSGDAVVNAVGISTIIMFFAAALIVIMSLPTKHWCAKLFNLSVLKSFGKYSYGIYIYHWALNLLVWEPLFPAQAIRQYTGYWLVASYSQFVMKVAASYGIAWLSWHMYEKHFLKLKRLFVCKPTQADATMPAMTTDSA